MQSCLRNKEKPALNREMSWKIEDLEFVMILFIIVMTVLLMSCFEGSYNFRGPEENVCRCDLCRAGEITFYKG